MSALPDALASHFSGTLAQIEAHVLATEQAVSIAAAAMYRRTEIELPGALRYLSRVCKAVHGALNSCRALHPESFSSLPATIIGFMARFSNGCVLISLRALIAHHLPQLPTPLGFNPSRDNPQQCQTRHQHQTGRDPPCALLDPVTEPVVDRTWQENPS